MSNSIQNQYYHNYFGNFTDNLLSDNIFSQLDRRNLLNCSQVDKRWESIVSNTYRLWTIFVDTLELPEKENFRKLSSEKILKLRYDVIEANKCLAKNIMSLDELKIVSQNLENLLNIEFFNKVKLDYANYINFSIIVPTGFKSSFLLYKINLCSLEKVAIFADALKQKLNLNYGWEDLIKHLILKEHKYEVASQYLLNLETPADMEMHYARGYLLHIEVERNCLDNKLDQAFSIYFNNFFASTKKYPRWEVTIKETLKYYSKKAQRYDLYQKIIDITNDKWAKYRMISILFRGLLKKNNDIDITQAITKYDSLLMTAEIRYLHFPIHAYIQAGRIDDVWKMLRNQRSWDHLMFLYHFRSALKDSQYIEEYEKVENFIKHIHNVEKNTNPL